jgi:excinuclease UvrABC nuclease subunit
VLTERLEFDRARDTAIFSAVPPAAAVFLLRGDDPKAEPYVSKTTNLRRRLERLLGIPATHAQRLNLRDRVRQIEYTITGSEFESGFLLYRLLRSTFPRTYADRLRLRFAPLLKLHMENQYPRASITTRLGRLGGPAVYYGPFASRSAAEKFANDSLDFFKMRRCLDDLHPDPQFPGCIYSEMKMCLAPCFEGCSDQQYHAEVARVQAYFDSGGQSLVREISRQRDQASATLDFERAALLHGTLEKLQPLSAQLPEIVRRIDQLAAIMVQPSASPQSVAFFSIAAGLITGPRAFPIQATEHAKSQSMESRVETALAELLPPSSKSRLDRMEHLALLRRWFYRSRRLGEIFLADADGTLPLRRLVRGIARVYRGEGRDAAIRM